MSKRGKHTSERPRLMVCRDGHTARLQISIDDASGGFRIAGPKFNGSSETLMNVLLDDRSMSEIEDYIARYRAAISAATGANHAR